MRKPITILCLAILIFGFDGFTQITVPAPSPAGSTYSKVGLTDVEINYSRPKMKGRKIFGEGSDFLQPYGDMWRSGANSGTTLTISTDISIDGKVLEKGEYLILTIPAAEEWTMIFYSDVSMGGNLSAYKEEKAALIAKSNALTLSAPVETLTFNISDIKADNTGASIELTWENISLKVPFTVNFDDEIMSQIETNTKVNPRNYIAAATYYFNSGKDANQALKWIQIYFKADPSNEDQFWNLHLMAQIQQAAGDNKGAKATAEKSLEKAKNNEGGDFGYIKRNEDLLASLK